MPRSTTPRRRSASPSIVLIEDPLCEQLDPVSALRPVWDIRTGALTLAERLALVAPRASIAGLARREISELSSFGDDVPNDRDALCINARALLGPADLDAILALPVGGAWRTASRVTIAARMAPGTFAQLKRAGARLGPGAIRPFLVFSGQYSKPTESSVPYLARPWDVVRHLDFALRADLDYLTRSTSSKLATLPRTVAKVGKGRIRIAKSATIEPFVVLDTTVGDIVISDGARIGAGSCLRGPVYIGTNTVVKPHALITGSAVGPECRVSGEISASIFQSYSNKQHEGFVGNSYVGSWVNLGAGTTTSNLKNTYSLVRAHWNGREEETGMTYLGSIIGDHVKTGIGTTFNTGTIIGIASNIFGAGFPPKEIPHLSWGGADGMQNHSIEKSIATARTSMARRGIELSPADERAMRRLSR